MACIKKLTSALAFDCDSGTMGFKDALFLNMADIASFSVVAPNKAFIAIAGGGKAYKIDTVKRSLVISESLRVNESAPNAFSHEAVINIFSKGDRAAQNDLRNASIVIVARGNDDLVRVYGLYYGLKASASAESSHDNGGWTQFTVSTPEGVIGEDSLYMTKDAYEVLYKAAVG
jgi:hypothetical protein